MKILLIHNNYQHWGGEDTVFEQEYQLLKKHGQAVEVLRFSNEDTLGASFLKKLRIGLKTFYNKDAFKKVETKIKAFHPDVIHVHNWFKIASPSVFYAAKKYHIPVVNTLHNYRLICANAILYRDGAPCELCVYKKLPLSGIRYKCHNNSAIESAFVTFVTSSHKYLGTWKNKVDKYIALTEFSRQKNLHSSLNLPPDKIVVKPNFVPDIPFKKQQRQDFFLYVGRLSQEKGIQVLLESLPMINNNITIIGDGPERQAVEAAAEKYPQVRYLGYKDKAFIIEQMRSCRAVIAPSVCYENMPMSVIEAFATGTPVIGSRVGTLPEIINEGQTGLLFTSQDAADLAENINHFFANVNNYDFMYEAAYNAFLENYREDYNYQLLMEIYEEVITK